MDTNRTTNEKFYSRTRTIASVWGADIENTHIIVGFEHSRSVYMRRSGAVRCSSLVTESSALQQGLWAFPQAEPWTDWSFTGTTGRSQRRGGSYSSRRQTPCTGPACTLGCPTRNPPPAPICWGHQKTGSLTSGKRYTTTTTRGGAIYTSRQTR